MCKCSTEVPNLIQLDGNISTDSILQDDDSSIPENNPPSAPPPFPGLTLRRSFVFCVSKPIPLPALGEIHTMAD